MGPRSLPNNVKIKSTSDQIQDATDVQNWKCLHRGDYSPRSPRARPRQEYISN